MLKVFTIAVIIFVGMFFYRSLERLIGYNFIPKSMRKGSDKIIRWIVKHILQILDFLRYTAFLILKGVPTYILKVLIIFWMKTLHFAIKIVSLLQDEEDKQFKNVITKHLKTVGTFKKNLQ